MPRCVPANSGASGASTLLPRIAASSSALVLMPTTAALCASESKKSARASPASGCAPPGGQIGDVAVLGEVDAVPLARVLRMGPDDDPQPAQGISSGRARSAASQRADEARPRRAR